MQKRQEEYLKGLLFDIRYGTSDYVRTVAKEKVETIVEFLNLGYDDVYGPEKMEMVFNIDKRTDNPTVKFRVFDDELRHWEVTKVYEPNPEKVLFEDGDGWIEVDLDDDEDLDEDVEFFGEDD